MSSQANPAAECVSETAEELIFQLRSSFVPQEFDYVAKTLTEREERMKQKYLDLKTKAKEEKDQLVSENLKLNDELKVKVNEIDGVMNLNAGYVREFKDYEKRCLEILELRTKDEEEKGLLVSKNLKLNEELKTKQNVIDVVKKVNSEYGRKLRVFEKRYIDELDLKTKVENEKRLLVSENLKLKDELKMKQNKKDAAMKRNAEYEKKGRAYDKLSLEYLEFKAKVEEEKHLLVSENLKLNDELKMKQKGIDAAMKQNAEYEKKVRDCEKQSMYDLELKTKAEEEKELLVSENLKLNDELKMKQNKIDAVIAEYEGKIRMYENRSLESDGKVLSSEKLAMEAVGSGMEQKDCASESYRESPLFSEKDGSKRKTAHTLHEIIEIDDDDDDDSEFVAPAKRRQTSNEETELKYSSRLYKHIPKQT